MAIFMAKPPRLSYFDRMTGDWVLPLVVLAALVLFCGGVVAVGAGMARDGRTLLEALQWSWPFFLAPASGLAVLAWRHLGALVVVAGGVFLTAGTVFALVAGAVSELWRTSLSDGALGFLLVFALPALLTGLYYAVRFPDGSKSN